MTVGDRPYDAVNGNWPTQDSIGFDGGSWNLKEFVGNNPVIWLDPSGLIRFPLPSCGTAAISTDAQQLCKCLPGLTKAANRNINACMSRYFARNPDQANYCTSKRVNTAQFSCIQNFCNKPCNNIVCVNPHDDTTQLWDPQVGGKIGTGFSNCINHGGFTFPPKVPAIMPCATIYLCDPNCIMNHPSNPGVSDKWSGTALTILHELGHVCNVNDDHDTGNPSFCNDILARCLYVPPPISHTNS